MSEPATKKLRTSDSGGGSGSTSSGGSGSARGGGVALRPPGDAVHTLFSSTTLAGKRALVTGARKGIGRGIALCLARAGCSAVGIVDIVDDEATREVVALINESGATGLVGVRARFVLAGSTACTTTTVNCAPPRPAPGPTTPHCSWLMLITPPTHAHTYVPNRSP